MALLLRMYCSWRTQVKFPAPTPVDSVFTGVNVTCAKHGWKPFTAAVSLNPCSKSCHIVFIYLSYQGSEGEVTSGKEAFSHKLHHVSRMEMLELLG